MMSYEAKLFLISGGAAVAIAAALIWIRLNVPQVPTP